MYKERYNYKRDKVFCGKTLNRGGASTRKRESECQEHSMTCKGPVGEEAGMVIGWLALGQVCPSGQVSRAPRTGIRIGGNWPSRPLTLTPGDQEKLQETEPVT